MLTRHSLTRPPRSPAAIESLAVANRSTVDSGIYAWMANSAPTTTAKNKIRKRGLSRLFAPAIYTVNNIKTGKTITVGQINQNLLKESFKL